MQNRAGKLQKELNRLEELFRQNSLRGKKALAVFLMGGDPDLSNSNKFLRAALQGGADLLEIGIPFSDPLADGPVIQKASGRALRHKTGVEHILSLVEDLRRDFQVPLVLLTYWNPVYRYGAEHFFQRASAAGVDGLVIPDLPSEEKYAYRSAAEKKGLLLIDFITPLTGDRRAEKILRSAAGFIYCVTITGLTGVRESLAETLAETSATARRHSTVPLLAGFGISSPTQACQAAQWTDGVIVGSALVDLIEKHLDDPQIIPEMIREKVQEFRCALDDAFPLDAVRG